MRNRNIRVISVIFILSLLVSACLKTNPQPIAPTPIPSLIPENLPTLNPDIQEPLSANTIDISTEEGQAAKGAALFEIHCSTCHGPQGQGIDGPPLRNSQTVQLASTTELFDIIASGVTDTPMPAWMKMNGGPLTSDEIKEIMAFLPTIQDVPEIPPVSMDEMEEGSAADSTFTEPARPSNPGEAGPAAALEGDPSRGQALFGEFCAACHGPQGRPEVGLPNPGSDDNVVPELNPIDPSLVDTDLSVFRINIDLFLEHGSVPDGDQPRIMMPAFGDSNMLTDEQIADVIAYLLYLNGAIGSN